MKHLLTPLLFIAVTTSVKAQADLRFDKRFIESEDRWVAFEKDNNDAHLYGFIYIDAEAGLTLNVEGTFTVAPTGEFVPDKTDSNKYNMKVRLQPNNVRVAFIPEKRFSELQISATPDWLHFYKTDTASIERLHRWGFLYNSWGVSEKALSYLEKAQAINPKYPGVEFELAYAYNATEQYEKAIKVLESAIKTSPKECYLYKELSFAQMNLNRLDKAAETCKKGIPLCKEDIIKCEIAYNMAYHYYMADDNLNFTFWATQTKKWKVKGDPVAENILKMIKEMENDMK
jgi:tetratricopeptide (TPR) repeat protein